MRYRFDNIELDERRRSLRRAGKTVAVEPRVFDLLLYLLRNRDRVVPKDELLDRLWPGEEVMEGALAVCVHRARHAIGNDEVIRTSPRRGYRFAAEVVELLDPELPAGQASGPPFAGRREEIALLEGAVNDALGGSSRVVFVVGEPGIGKTRILEEMGRYARERGAGVFWGEGNRHAGEAPFNLWVEVFDSYLSSQSREEIDSVLGQEAQVLRPLLPVLPTLQRFVPGTVGDSQTDLPRLLDAGTAILRRAASRHPLILILDDLHAADRDSLLVIPSLAQAAAGTPVLLAGSYRDTDLAVDHPLRTILSELTAQGRYEVIPLGPLAETDLAACVEHVAGAPIAPPVLKAVVTRAEGNPLFAGEYWRYLSRRGLVARTAEGWIGRGDLEIRSVPAGIAGIIQERLARLSAPCRRLLETAATVGREFDRDVLVAAAGVTADECDRALGEAAEARVVSRVPEAAGRFRFSHGLIVERLYALLLPGERVSIHRRIANILDQRYGNRPDGHLSELAHHFVEGADAESADRAIEFATRAANQAFANLAFQEAALRFQQGLAVLEHYRPASKQRRWQLLVGLAETFVRTGDLPRARRAFESAVEALHGDQPAGRSVSHTPHDRIEVTRTLAYMRLSLHVPSGPGPIRRTAGAERWESLRTAIDRARSAEDPDTLLWGVIAARWNAFDAPHLRERLALSTEAVLLAEQLEHVHLLQEARSLHIHDLLVGGRIAEADEEIARYAELAESIGEPFYLWISGYVRAMRAIVAGRFAEAEQLAREALRAGSEPAGEVAEATFGTQITSIRALQGSITELMSQVQAFVDRYPARDVGRALLASLYCEIGRQAEARAELDSLEDSLLGEAHGPLWLHTITGVARPCARVGHARLAAALFDQLKPFADACVVVPVAVAFNGPVAIYLGLFAETAGRRKEATRYFEQGMEICTRLGAHPTLAHAQYEFGRALLARGGRTNRVRALMLLKEAQRTALELKMIGLSKWTEKLQTDSVG